MVEGDGERVFERGKSGGYEMLCRVREVVEELASNMDGTYEREIKEC